MAEQVAQLAVSLDAQRFTDVAFEVADDGLGFGEFIAAATSVLSGLGGTGALDPSTITDLVNGGGLSSGSPTSGTDVLTSVLESVTTGGFTTPTDPAGLLTGLLTNLLGGILPGLGLGL